MADEFSRFHPLVNLIFYVAVMGITMFQMQAGLILISLVCAGVYHFTLKGLDGLKYVGILLGVFAVSACVNPLFSHKGQTLLFYLFTGNPVTLESIIYGVAAAAILCAVLLWFSSFNVIITEDKLTAVIGRFMPHTSMLITMILRFVPKFAKQGKAVATAQKALNAGEKNKKNSIWHKINLQADVFSITTTWALENSVDTADSMRARGYGSGKRTSYNNYRLELRDWCVLVWIIVLSVYVCISVAMDKAVTFYYPSVRIKNNITVYIIYTMLCITPVLINVLERLRWYRLKSKI